jgi:hypothetical protein
MNDLHHLHQLLHGLAQLLHQAEQHPATTGVTAALIADARTAIRHALDGLPTDNTTEADR